MGILCPKCVYGPALIRDDGWEVSYSLGPADNGTATFGWDIVTGKFIVTGVGDPQNGPEADPDGDYLGNMLEYRYSSDPLVVDSDGDGIADSLDNCRFCYGRTGANICGGNGFHHDASHFGGRTSDSIDKAVRLDQHQIADQMGGCGPPLAHRARGPQCRRR